jgi:hypothetical protein
MTMSTEKDNLDPTADWRKYPKGPNFLGIVIGASVFLIVALVATWFLLHMDARKLVPQGPNREPNSVVHPLLPSPSQSRDSA